MQPGDHAIAFLSHFGGLQQFLQPSICLVIRQEGGKPASHRNQSRQRGGLAGGRFVARGDLFYPQRAELAKGKPGVTLAMIVESDSSGSESPNTLIAPLSENGSPICPTPHASASSGTS